MSFLLANTLIKCLSLNRGNVSGWIGCVIRREFLQFSVSCDNGER